CAACDDSLSSYFF
nr:immunoglobulin light chain junction region [Macaca mulatta]